MNTELNTPVAATPAAPAAREGRSDNRNDGRGPRREREREPRERSEFVDKLIGVRRVAKTVKGGRRMAFGALVVVGDEAGRVGWGKGKSREVSEAVKKATEDAKHAMVRVALRQGRTIHHEVNGRFGATRVIIKPAVPGTGIIAGGPMRAIFEAMGVKDVVAKAMGSTNPYNLIQATFAAFGSVETPRGIAAKRGLQLTDLTLHKTEAAKGEVDQKTVNEDLQKAREARKAALAAKAKEGRGGDRKGGKRDGGRDGGRSAAAPGGDRPRGAAGKRPDAVQAVSKAASMQAAVAPKPEAEAAPAAVATPAAE
jgi:small subunit ribosomal protein S5